MSECRTTGTADGWLDSRASSAGPAEALEAITFAPTRTMLSNGLTVLHQANPVSPAATMSLRVAAGAAFETHDTAGLANFSAGMLKRGTVKRSKEQIGEVLDFTGAHLSSSAGRHTATVAAKCRGSDFETMLELVAECIATPSLPPPEVEKLRGDLLTGIREDADDPRQVAMDRLREIIYPRDHPYCWRVTGTEATVERHDRDALAAFHAKHYGPAGAVLVVVGAVDVDRTLAATERIFGEWAAPTGPSGPDGGGLPAALPQIADAPGPARIERVVANMPSKSQADIALGHPGLRRRDPDYYAASVMNMILGRFAMGGRLGRTIREEQGMAYYTFSTLDAGVGPGAFVVRAGVHPSNVERALDSIVSEIERLATAPVEEQELADATSALIRSVPRTLETNEGMAVALHLIEQYQLGLDYLERYPKLIGEVTVEAVQEVAHKRLHPDRYGVAIAGPYSLEAQ